MFARITTTGMTAHSARVGAWMCDGGVPEGGAADEVDQRDMDQAGIGRGDLVAVGGSEGRLAG